MNGLVITSAVCRKIHAIYPDISVYREHIDDDFDEPSFFVWTSGVENSPKLWPSQFQTHKIEVNFFPVRGSCSMYETLLEIGSELSEHLARIEVEIGSGTKAVFGSNISYNIVDDNLLVFSVEYKIETHFDNEHTVRRRF